MNFVNKQYFVIHANVNVINNIIYMKKIRKTKNKRAVLINMMKIPPCDLPLVPMVPLAAENVQGFLVTIGKNGTNSTIGRFADFTIGRTPNVAPDYQRGEKSRDSIWQA